MEEKEFPPTIKRRQEAKKKGEVAKSEELSSSLFLLVVLGIIGFSGDKILSALGLCMKNCFGAFQRTDEEPLQLIRELVQPLVYPIAITLAGLFIAAIAFHFLQTGWIFSFPQGKRKRGAEPYRLFLACLKIALIGAITYLSIKNFRSTREIAPTLFFFALKVAIGLLVISIGDFFYQKWRFEKSLYMTHAELKEEMREDKNRETAKQRLKERPKFLKQ